jgi:hypothetical protein
MWSLADELPVKSGYSLGSGADGPLTRDEIAAYSREIGERREAWRDACDAHLADLYRAHEGAWR